jgi:hypothetical protein
MINLPDDIYKGMRVLFKKNHGWQIGELYSAKLDDNLTFSVIDINGDEITDITGDNIFFNTRVLDEWEQDYVYNKEDFLQRYEDGEFSPTTHTAWVSDGEYVYYRVDKWNKNWLSKQPLSYVFCA